MKNSPSQLQLLVNRIHTVIVPQVHVQQPPECPEVNRNFPQLVSLKTHHLESAVVEEHSVSQLCQEIVVNCEPREVFEVGKYKDWDRSDAVVVERQPLQIQQMSKHIRGQKFNFVVIELQQLEILHFFE